MPSLVTFWPVLPRVTSGMGDAGGAARMESATDRAAPVAAAVFKKRRRLPPHDPSIVAPPRSNFARTTTPAARTPDPSWGAWRFIVSARRRLFNNHLGFLENRIRLSS